MVPQQALRRLVLGIAGPALLFASTVAPAADRAVAARPVNPAVTLLFASTFRQIEDYYLDPVSLQVLATAGLMALDSPDGGFVVKEANYGVELVDHGELVERLAEPHDDDVQGWAELVSSAITVARTHAGPLLQADDEQIFQLIFDGLLPKLDKFTRYAGRDKARDQRGSREGFGGIGVTLDYSEPAPRISTIVRDGPSFRAGLRVDDRIIAIDGVAVTQLDQHLLVERLRGAIDSRVTLTVARPGTNQPLSIAVLRGLIVQPTVTADKTDGIAVFHVDGFNAATGADLAREVRTARTELGTQFKGAILDLRDNPGGLLDQAVAVSSMFLARGDIVSTRGRHPTATQHFSATAEDRLGGLPLVVLVNGASASSAEIVAAALQDNGRAVVVGSSSYGKGTVQMVLQLENGGELTLTWARLITPLGYLLHHHGVVPTFCTSYPIDPIAPPEDDSMRTQQIVDTGLHPTLSLMLQPRVTLTDEAWTALRQTCAPENRDNALDIQIAHRLIQDPKLYAQALSLEPVTVAHVGHPTASPLQ